MKSKITNDNERREYKNSRGNHIIRRSVPNILFIGYSSFQTSSDAIGQWAEWGLKRPQARHRHRLRARRFWSHRLPRWKRRSSAEGGGAIGDVVWPDRRYRRWFCPCSLEWRRRLLIDFNDVGKPWRLPPGCW